MQMGMHNVEALAIKSMAKRASGCTTPEIDVNFFETLCKQEAEYPESAYNPRNVADNTVGLNFRRLTHPTAANAYPNPKPPNFSLKNLTMMRALKIDP
eukprot:6511654-Karenia_brevis.AAC.1